ncbi:site-specific integrase [Streptomyces griseus]|uniref:Integrase/recombinase n=2 Tax=Streptomyces TaxID=1883 RepID=B1VR34_STRGG|nr:site-specific integrase [Streptomyces griseus]BAG20685.1 putative integrase/recombinase [Streptomyces griseus subsp. griseus NBRC 13350]SEE76194.1 Phage integrase family protein [Streptomyces griseus]SQA20462.1 integrase/recombinase [Streptomyces griseus]
MRVVGDCGSDGCGEPILCLGTRGTRGELGEGRWGGMLLGGAPWTVRTALNEAVRRGHLTVNPASVAKAPRLEEEEVEPYTVDEVHKLLDLANKTGHPARWVVSLALGLRQGEVLGLKWTDVDFELRVMTVHRNRLRPRYEHGCGNHCGRKPGYCPQKVNIRRETKDTKSRAGRRPIGNPEPLVQLLLQHRRAQERDRRAPQPEHRPPRVEDLLKAAGLRAGRLHDARHTAATVLLILGVPDTVVDAIMGWEPGKSARMRRRYQHLTNRVLTDAADKIGGLLWPLPEEPPAADRPWSQPGKRLARTHLSQAGLFELAVDTPRRLTFRRADLLLARWCRADRPDP